MTRLVDGAAVAVMPAIAQVMARPATPVSVNARRAGDERTNFLRIGWMCRSIPYQSGQALTIRGRSADTAVASVRGECKAGGHERALDRTARLGQGNAGRPPRGPPRPGTPGRRGSLARRGPGQHAARTAGLGDHAEGRTGPGRGDPEPVDAPG